MHKTKKILFFITVIIALHYFLSAIYQNITRNDLSRKKIESFETEENNEVLYLVAGNSHGGVAIDPRVIDDCFNLCIGGSSIFQVYYLINNYIANGLFNSKYLILNFDPHDAFISRDRIIGNAPLYKKFINFFDLCLETNFDEIFLDYSISSLLPYLGKGEKLFRSVNTNTGSMMLYRGYIIKNLLNSEDFYSQLEKHLERLKLYNKTSADYLPIITNYYKRIFELAQNHSFKVILIKYPMYSLLLEQLNRVDNVRKFYGSINSLLQKYQSCVKVLDFSEFNNKNQSFFKDSHHLNYKGAKLFTQALIDSLEIAGLN